MAFGAMNSAARENPYLKYLGMLAIGCLFVAVLTFIKAGDKDGTEAGALGPVASVLIPESDISAGTTVESSMFRVEERVISELPASYVGSYDSINFSYTLYPLKANVPFSSDALSSRNPSNEVTGSIPKGHRAVTIRVDARSAVEGWAKPGARVDVVWTTTVDAERALKVIVENAKVLSAERKLVGEDNVSAGIDAPMPSTVTLLVTNEESKRIQFAATMGVLSLSLRGEDDLDKGQAGSKVTLRQMLGASTSNEINNAVLTVKNRNGQKVRYTLQNGELRRKKPKPIPAFEPETASSGNG